MHVRQAPVAACADSRCAQPRRPLALYPPKVTRRYPEPTLLRACAVRTLEHPHIAGVLIS